MKLGKIITFITIPIFVLALTACGTIPDSSETESISSADFESAEGKQIRLITDNTEVTVTRSTALISAAEVRTAEATARPWKCQSSPNRLIWKRLSK